MRDISKRLANKAIRKKQGKALVKNAARQVEHYAQAAGNLDAEKPEQGAVQKLADEAQHHAENAKHFIKNRARASFERRSRISKNRVAGLTYGNPNDIGRRAATSTRILRTTGGRAAQTARKAARKSYVLSSGQAMKSVAPKTAARAAQKSFAKLAGSAIKAVGKSIVASISKYVLPLAVVAVGAVALIIMIVFGFQSMASPVGFFLSNDAATATQGAVKAADVVNTVNAVWLAQLQSTRASYDEQGYVVDVRYNPNDYDDGGQIDNWKDVLSLYVILHSGRDNQTFVVLNQGDEESIKNLYFEMNPTDVNTWTETIEKEVQEEVTEHVTEWNTVYNPSTGRYEQYEVTYSYTHTVTKTVTEEIRHADISVRNLRYPQVLGQYQVTDIEREWIESFTSAEANPFWDMLDIAFNNPGAFTGDVDIIINNLPTSGAGSDIVKAALTRIGDPYSMELRGQGAYVDCSYLAQWAYAQVGISIPGTAADQAQYCVSNQKVIAASAAQPGDLIFWSYPTNPRVAGRFMAIGHVAIYAGGGMMVEAAPSAGGVTYRAVAVQGTPVIYARPYV